MRQLRRVSPFLITLVLSLFYCSQVCVAAGHVHAAVLTARPDSHSADATPCHSPSTTPQNTGDQCPDCGDHFFLISTPSGMDIFTASRTVLSTVCSFSQLTPSLEVESVACCGPPDPHVLSSPRYLSLSVLRL